MPNPKSLITGVTGFVGKYLSDYLRSCGHQVFGIDRWERCSYPQISYSQIDILDTAGLARLLASIAPDFVYHLAAISYLPEADASPRHALDVNIMGTVSVLDAIKQTCPSARVLLVGSSKQYGDNPDTEFVDETACTGPTNFYGISKHAAEMIGGQYVRQFGMDIRFSRSFNHTGPGQSPRFVCSDWAKQVVEVEQGKPARIDVGDLEATIDFSDVRDVVRAYALILEKGTKGSAYNVCSNSGVSLQWILSYLTSKASVPIAIHMADKKLRAHKTSYRMVGNNQKLRQETGWECRIPLSKTLDDLHEYWVGQLSGEPAGERGQ